MSGEESKPKETLPASADYDGIQRGTFDWNRVPSWPFLIYAGMMMVAIFIPDPSLYYHFNCNFEITPYWIFKLYIIFYNFITKSHGIFNHLLTGDMFWIVWNWLMLITSIYLIIKYIKRNQLNIFVPMTFCAGMGLATLAISYNIYEISLEELTILDSITVVFTYIIYFPSLFLLLFAITRKYEEMPISHRILEEIISSSIIPISVFGIYILILNFFYPIHIVTTIFNIGIFACLIAISYAAIISLLNCIKYNKFVRYANLRIWGY